MNPDETLQQLEQSVAHLLRNYQEVCRQLQILEEANQRQRDEILRTHTELTELQQQYKKLQTAHALVAESPQRDVARRQLTAIIKKIDTTINLLQDE